MDNKNEIYAESMKKSLSDFLTEFNAKLHSDKELDALALVLKDSLIDIYKKTGIMYCSCCGTRMTATSIDRASGQQFTCPDCGNSRSLGGLYDKL